MSPFIDRKINSYGHNPSVFDISQSRDDMNELAELQKQIKTLQNEAAVIKARDFTATVKEIQMTMQIFGITANDLQAVQRKPRKVKDTAAVENGGKSPSIKIKASSKPVVAKYLGPEGQTWSGRGLSPQWLATLVLQGAKREDFLIQKQLVEST